MSIAVYAVERPDLPPVMMPERFRTEIAYFMSLPAAGGPALPADEYMVLLADASKWLDEGVFRLVSPLDSAAQAEIELSEEQETWLEWMVNNQVERIRLVRKFD
jgi:hypothetical protein